MFASILPIGYDHVLPFYELQNKIAKFHRVYTLEGRAKRSDAILMEFVAIRI